LTEMADENARQHLKKTLEKWESAENIALETRKNGKKYIVNNE